MDFTLIQLSVIDTSSVSTKGQGGDFVQTVWSLTRLELRQKIPATIFTIPR